MQGIFQAHLVSSGILGWSFQLSLERVQRPPLQRAFDEALRVSDDDQHRSVMRHCFLIYLLTCAHADVERKLSHKKNLSVKSNWALVSWYIPASGGSRVQGYPLNYTTIGKLHSAEPKCTMNIVTVQCILYITSLIRLRIFLVTKVWLKNGVSILFTNILPNPKSTIDQAAYRVCHTVYTVVM